jgi:tetratricopeptide (TPR) repeat protein
VPDRLFARSPVRPLVLSALALAAFLLPAVSVRADGTMGEEERKEQIATNVERGWKAFQNGNHDEALARMKRLATVDPEHPLPPYLTARVKERTGDYAEALDVATQANAKRPDDRPLQALRFQLLFTLGKSEEAERLARTVLGERPDDLVARTVLGMALEERGRREEALREYDAVVAAFNKADVPGEALPYVSRAAIRATWLSPNPKDDMIPEALSLLVKRIQAEPVNHDLVLQYANVWLEDRGKKGQSTASKYFRQALKENEELAEARVGLAQVALVFYQQDQAMQMLERALETNPRLVPALTLLASINVGNGDYEKADTLLARALAVNPTDKRTRAVKAARLWIGGDKAGFEALKQEILAYDPTYGRLWLTVSDLVGERQRRYDTAAELAEKAIAVDPADSLAYVTLGEALMNLGRIDEARQAFDTSIVKAKDYADVKRDNWLEALGWMKPWPVVVTPRLRVRMAPSEAPVLEPYLVPLMEEAWDVLTKKYGLALTPIVHVDAFHRADDFSVRSVGVPGLPALGVCFGKVITLLGPTAQPVGGFSWSRTAWHEFAHVVTLGLSEGQVPRWLTEGLSVYEEQARRPRWGRDMDRELFDRWSSGRLLKMEKINAAFRGPDIMFAYYQGGLIAEHLTESRGFEVIPKMLRRFADDRTTAQVFHEVLGIELKDYDAAFEEFVKKHVGDYRMVPRWDDESLAAFTKRTEADPKDVEAWIRRAWALLQRGVQVDAEASLAKALALAPDRPDVILLEGRLAQGGRRADVAEAHYRRFLAAGGDDLGARLFLASRVLERGADTEQAVKHLEAAKVCFPRYLAKDSPYLQLAKLYRANGQLEKAMGELEAFAAIAAEDYPVRKELKAWHKQRKDAAAVARVCEEMVDITPFGANRNEEPDLTLHRDYADALMTLDRREEALRERRVQVVLVSRLPDERRVAAGEVDDRLALGQLLLDLGKRDEAREQATAVLRLSPGHAGARVLQGKASEVGGG